MNKISYMTHKFNHLIGKKHLLTDKNQVPTQIKDIAGANFGIVIPKKNVVRFK